MWVKEEKEELARAYGRDKEKGQKERKDGGGRGGNDVERGERKCKKEEQNEREGG